MRTIEWAPPEKPAPVGIISYLGEKVLIKIKIL